MESEEIYIDSYRLVAKLGSGAFGDVYLGQHAILTDRFVAIKLMHATDLDSSEAMLRFFTEAQILNKLKHPHILPIINVSAYGGIPYLVTEYASNGSLRDRLKRQYPRLLPIEEAIAILAQIGEALQYAHQQNPVIIHRDLKPENILFNDKGDALLADFGIAAILTTASVKQTSTTGTMAYMAPEQFHEMVCKESDQYALGCIAYELFTGHMPFNASNLASLITKCLMEQPIAPRHYNPGLPLHIERAVLKALAKQRTKRHADIFAFIEALRTSTNSQIRIHAVSQTTTSDPTPKTKEQWMNKGNACFKVKHEVAGYPYNSDGEELNYPDDDVTDKMSIASKHIHSIFTNSADFYNEKGILLVQQQHFQEALEAFEQALRLNPNYSSAYYGMGNAYLCLKRYAESLAAFEHTIRIDPNFAPAYSGKSTALCGLKRYQEALLVSERAIQLDPNLSYAYIIKSFALQGLGRAYEADETYEKALQLGL